MLKSMTAFGRAAHESSLGRYSVEIQSVNRKFLEVACFLPKELARFESAVRKWVSESVVRGQVTIKIFAYFDKGNPLTVKPNLGLARQIKNAWDEIARELQVPADKGFTLQMLLEEQGVLTYEENVQNDDLILADLKIVVSEALEPFLAMKIAEGIELQRDISARVDKIDSLIEQVSAKAVNAPSKYRQKLLERIQEVAPGCSDNEDKVLREVALYADRIDVTEEITRFKSHIKQVRQLLKGSDEGVGKTLEFLIQELNREANTTGSKSNDVEVTQHVVEIKSELERIREQVQNIE